MAYDKLTNGINKVISILEKVNDGIELFNDILNSDDSTMHLPVIPARDEVEEYLENFDILSENASALRAYRTFANSMSAYSKFWVEQWNSKYSTGDNSFDDELEQASVECIVRIFYEIHFVLDEIQKIKLGSDRYTELLNRYLFMTKFMFGYNEEMLSETYDIDFFDDLSELWELLVATIDAIHDKYGAPAFSDRLQQFNEHITAINEYTASVLGSNCSRWTKKRTLKKYVKLIRTSSAGISDILRVEAKFLKA